MDLLCLILYYFYHVTSIKSSVSTRITIYNFIYSVAKYLKNLLYIISEVSFTLFILKYTKINFISYKALEKIVFKIYMTLILFSLFYTLYVQPFIYFNAPFYTLFRLQLSLLAHIFTEGIMEKYLIFIHPTILQKRISNFLLPM